MPSTIALGCKCGKVSGQVEDVAPERVNRVLCYCDDCRAYLHFLERSDLLEDHGGTDIVQVDSGTVRFTAGQDELRCMRLSPKGMTRWYCGSCHTPVGNTVAAAVPFVGIVRSCLDAGVSQAGSSAEAVLGRAESCNAKWAVHGTPVGAHRSASLALIARTAKLLLRWKLSGRSKSTPYFDPATGRPRREPRVLTEGERGALRARDTEPKRAG
jgi:hypothetical protein